MEAAAAILMWVLLSNGSNKKRKQIQHPNTLHYVRAQQSLKYMDTGILMRASGLRHEEDSDVIMQAIRKSKNEILG